MTTTTDLAKPAARKRPAKNPPLVPALTDLDVDQLDDTTRGIGRRLTDLVVNAATALRLAREERLAGQPATKADVADEILRLQHAAEVLTRIAADFAAAAKRAQGEITTTVLEALGTDRVAIPDTDGTEIVVGPTVKNVYHINDAAIAEVEARRALSDYDPEAVLSTWNGDVAAAISGSYEHGFREGWAKVGDYGKISWRSTDVTKLTRTLMAAAEMELAATVERAMTKGVDVSDDLKVAREAFKPGRRS